MPIDYSLYPKDWKAIRARILARADNKCEGSPAYPECRAANGEPHPVSGGLVILTIAHLDHNRDSVDETRLKSMCQRCHLTYDARHHATTRRRRRSVGQGELWP